MNTPANQGDLVRRTIRGWSAAGGRISIEVENTERGPGGALSSHPFLIDETPHVIWDHALEEKNREFLDGIDPGYFLHLAEAHATFVADADPEQRQWSTAALRIAYSMALETFCALLATSVQSPYCALGWMLRYRNQDLERVIQKLCSGTPLRSALPERFTWIGMSELVHRFDVDAPLAGQEAAIRTAFANAWRRFALEFVGDRTGADEYNSLKHGSRARIGGFTLSVGAEITPGVPPDSSAMTKPSGSSYGSFFPVAQKLGERRDWTVTRCARNWVPSNLITGISLLSMSIYNLLCFLRQHAGDPSPQQFQGPADSRLFTAPWSVRLEFDEIVEHSTVRVDELDDWTDSQIRDLYPLR